MSVNRRRYHPAIVTAALLIAGTITLAFSRNFFPLSLVALFFLAPLALATLATALLKRAPGKVILTTLLLTIFASAVGYSALRWHDYLWFTGWAAIHAATLASPDPHDRILSHWDSWGFAGSVNNDSYLIRDVKDASTTVAGAEQWRVHMKLKCEIVVSARMWRQLYVITTADCEFPATT